MKKKLLLLAVLLVAGGAYYWYGRPQSAQPLVLYGNIDIRQVNTAFRVGGRLNAMNFEEGDVVHQGDVLAELDNEPFVNAQNQANAKITQAEAALENARRINKRKQALCKTKNASQQDCDTALANQEIAAADLEYAKSSADVAQTALNDTTLKSPADGVVLIRILEPGTMISAGVPVYTISLNDKMWVRAYIKETELGRVKIGTPVKVYTDSSDKVYDGHVGFISSTAEFTPKSIETASLRTDLVYRLRIVIDNADDYLKQGMPVTIKMAQ
ncbi:MAG: efflux RND transporter periplasmic adaptor subunit [Alphaproteobacteria bacterium]|nr:efflux RND transporter periplasmic adaptor subunit [Alphaproteobacteria bacterium]